MNISSGDSKNETGIGNYSKDVIIFLMISGRINLPSDLCTVGISLREI